MKEEFEKFLKKVKGIDINSEAILDINNHALYCKHALLDDVIAIEFWLDKNVLFRKRVAFPVKEFKWTWQDLKNFVVTSIKELTFEKMEKELKEINNGYCDLKNGYVSYNLKGDD